MTITFIDPINPASGGLYDPVKKRCDLSGIPDKPGVYIWGPMVHVDGHDFFAPCYVGETGKKDGLQGRLKEHYHGQRSNGGSRKELFDFSKQKYTCEELQARYHSMCVYDTIVNHKLHGRSKLDLAIPVPHLIYWQDPHFMYRRCALPVVGPAGSRSTQASALQLLKQIDPPDRSGLQSRIGLCKANFDHRFYCLYWEHPTNWFLTDDARNAYLSIEAIKHSRLAVKQKQEAINVAHEKAFKPGLEAMEYATKDALKSIGVYTTAEAKLEKSKHGKYPAVTIVLPETRMVHDLWSPPRVRTIKVDAR